MEYSFNPDKPFHCPLPQQELTRLLSFSPRRLCEHLEDKAFSKGGHFLSEFTRMVGDKPEIFDRCARPFPYVPEMDEIQTKLLVAAVIVSQDSRLIHSLGLDVKQDAWADACLSMGAGHLMSCVLHSEYPFNERCESGEFLLDEILLSKKPMLFEDTYAYFGLLDIPTRLSDEDVQEALAAFYPESNERKYAAIYAPWVKMEAHFNVDAICDASNGFDCIQMLQWRVRDTIHAIELLGDAVDRGALRSFNAWLLEWHTIFENPAKSIEEYIPKLMSERAVKLMRDSSAHMPRPRI